MANYLGDFAEDAMVRGTFNTRAKATGAPITLAGSPTLAVYKDGGVTESTAGVTLTPNFDTVTGHHLFAIDTSANAFYATGSDYRIVLTAGTVDGESVVGVEVGSFSIQNRYAVSGSGFDAAGLREALGLATANLDTQLADIPTVAEFEARTILAANYLTTLGANAPANWINAAAIAANAMDSKGNWNVGKTGYTLTETTGLGNQTADIIGTITTATNLTNAPTAGDLTATMKASVNTEVDTAIETYHLDHLLAAAYDPAVKPGSAAGLLNVIVENDAGVPRYTANALELAPTGGSGPTASAIADEVQTRTIAAVTTVTTTTNLTNLPIVPTNWLTASGIAAGALDGKGNWNVGKTGYALTQVFPANFASLGVNVLGHIERVTLVDTTTTNIDMRGTENALLASSYTAPANADIAAIKAKTDNLPVDPADQSAVEAAITASTSLLATAANLAIVAGYLDTEIAAILADTNELQIDWANGGRLDLILDARASQASVDDIPTNAEFESRSLLSADYFVIGDYTAPLTSLGATAPANWINAAAIAANAITDAKIASNAFTAAKFAAGAFDAVWSVAARTLTAFGFNVTVGTNSDKTGYGLTPGERDAIAVEVESHLLDEGDSQMLINAIVGAISNTNIDQAILIAAIRSDLERSGGNLNTLITRIAGTIRTASDDVTAETAQTAAVRNGLALEDTSQSIVADTNELQTDWANGGRLDLILDARASQASVDDIPTSAEFNARTLVAASYATANQIPANFTTATFASAGVFATAALANAPSGSGPTAAAIADAVWDEAIAGHLSAGSTGAALNAAGGSGDPWITTLPGAYTGTQAGKILADILADTAAIPTALQISGVISADISNLENGWDDSIEAIVIGVWGYGLDTGVFTGPSLLNLANRILGTLAAGTHEPQTGDSFARLGAPAAASIAADIANTEASKAFTFGSGPTIQIADTAKRQITWPTASETITGTIQWDEQVSKAITGAITFRETISGNHFYDWAYNAADRPPVPGYAVIQFTDGVFTDDPLVVGFVSAPTVSAFEARTLLAGDYFVVGDYTAPANADIAAIKVKTDTLPVSPASTSDVQITVTPNVTVNPTELSTGSVDAIRSGLSTLTAQQVWDYVITGSTSAATAVTNLLSRILGIVRTSADDVIAETAQTAAVRDGLSTLTSLQVEAACDESLHNAELSLAEISGVIDAAVGPLALESTSQEIKEDAAASKVAAQSADGKINSLITNTPPEVF